MPLPMTTSFCFVSLSSMVCLSLPTAPRHGAASVVLGGAISVGFARPVGGRRADGNGGL
jgi:hypothetical protein